MAATVDAFDEGRVRVVVRPDSRLGPTGWVGAVALGRAAIVTVPDDPTEALVRQVIASVSPTALPDFDWRTAGASAVIGPAALFFGDREQEPKDDGVDELAVRDEGLANLIRRVPPEEASEAGVEKATSPVFVIREDRRVVSACGYARWPESIAHMSVLTDPSFRRRGYAARVASVALSHARNEGLLAQWRARPVASQQLALSLGLTRLGAQTCARFDRT